MVFELESLMSMRVTLSSDMESFVKSKVQSGSHGDADAVVVDALLRMKEEDARTAAWQAAIRRGDEELDRGEEIFYTPTLLAELADEAIRAMHSGRPIDPDVLP